MAEIPKGIEVWTCPECGCRSLTIAGRGHVTGCSRWPAGRGIVNRYVPAEPIEELRDLIGDAIERGLSEPLRIAEGENEETVRALARAAAAGNPDTMRRVVLIQRAVVSALSTKEVDR